MFYTKDISSRYTKITLINLLFKIALSFLLNVIKDWVINKRIRYCKDIYTIINFYPINISKLIYPKTETNNIRFNLMSFTILPMIRVYKPHKPHIEKRLSKYIHLLQKETRNVKVCFLAVSHHSIRVEGVIKWLGLKVLFRGKFVSSDKYILVWWTRWIRSVDFIRLLWRMSGFVNEF